MEIGLIGIGSIGTFLIEQLNKQERITGYQVTAIFDDRDKPNQRLDDLSKEYNIQVYTSLDSFLESSINLVVECANIEVVEQYALEIIQQKDLMLISVGALVNRELHQALQEKAQHFHRKVYLPSGAIGGLDVIRAANELGGLTSVQLTTRKPSAALSVDIQEDEEVIFEGNAKQAIARFPKNTNIAIVLSLAGLGMEETRVKIIADPDVTKNIHQLEATGDFGNFNLTLENNPSPDNPKTSYLTALSILATLRSLSKAIVLK